MQEYSEFVSAKEMARRLGIGLSTVWNKANKGLLPQPDLKMGKRCTRWNWDNVVAFLQENNGKGGNQ